MARGVLVVFEGAEGAGKTTQLRRLEQWLRVHGVAVTALREPGGTRAGERIRELLLDPSGELSPATEALLFMASRAELVASCVRPALERGEVVLLDRFFLSTYAYQVDGRGLPEAAIRGANQLAVQGLVPDITLLLDLATDAGMARADARGARDRMERAGDAFHERVGLAFRTFLSSEWQQAHPECGRIVRVDAAGTEDAVFDRVREALATVSSEQLSVALQSHSE